MYGEYTQVKRPLFSVDIKTPLPHLEGRVQSQDTSHKVCVCVCVCYVKVETFLFKILRNFLSTNYVTNVPCVLCVIVRNCHQVIEISLLVWFFASETPRERSQNKEINFMLLVRCIFLYSEYCQQMHLINYKEIQIMQHNP
jgi:hypothetical protein